MDARATPIIIYLDELFYFNWIIAKNIMLIIVCLNNYFVINIILFLYLQKNANNNKIRIIENIKAPIFTTKLLDFHRCATLISSEMIF